MFLRATSITKRIGFCACFVLTGTACNVDWMWRDRQSPQGPVVAEDFPRGAQEPVDVSVVEVQEVDLVEAMISHREAYHRSLKKLRDYYDAKGQATKLSWAEYELAGVQAVKPFRYVLDAEIPDASLHPTEHVAEADKMYEKGKELMRRGGHGIPVFYRGKTMVQAAKILRDLVVKYPTSDKIDDAAFLLGEIHKEYMHNQEPIAVKWYERAWTWDPKTPHPARFQAAVVYDYRLHDRDRALELYKQVVDCEKEIPSNVRFASRRIHELSNDQPGYRAASR